MPIEGIVIGTVFQKRHIRSFIFFNHASCSQKTRFCRTYFSKKTFTATFTPCLILNLNHEKNSVIVLPSCLLDLHSNLYTIYFWYGVFYNHTRYPTPRALRAISHLPLRNRLSCSIDSNRNRSMYFLQFLFFSPFFLKATSPIYRNPLVLYRIWADHFFTCRFVFRASWLGPRTNNVF